MRITFTRTEVYETEGYRKGPKFEKGDTYDCRSDFGDRWVALGAAEVVEGSFPEPKPPTRWAKVETKAAAASPAADPAKGAAASGGAGANGKA